MGFDAIKIQRGLRVIITCVSVYLITWYAQIQEREWALLTIILVMFEYTNVGGVMQKSYFRLFGTTLSGCYGLFIIYSCKNNVLINILAFIPMVFMYIYYFLDTEKNYIAIIGCVTLSIVLLNNNQIDAAILRLFNILIGILASLFMVRFFYPTYASDGLFEIHTQCINDLLRLLAMLQDQTHYSIDALKTHYAVFETQVNAQLTKLKRDLTEAAYESRESAQYLEHQRIAGQHMQRLLQLLGVFIGYLNTESVRQQSNTVHQITQLINQLQRIQTTIQTNTHNTRNQSSATLPGLPPASGVAEPVVLHMHQEALLLEQALTAALNTYQHATARRTS